LLVNETNDAPERLDVIVTPNAEVLRTDAAFRQDHRRFCHEQSPATDCAAAEMHAVSVVRQPIGARILTEGDKDAVGKFDIANRERIEQVNHANTLA
jgi:hypothetical protein